MALHEPSGAIVGAAGIGALFALVAEGLLITFIVRLGLAANRRGDLAASSAARRLFIASPLIGIGTLVRVARYLMGGDADVAEVALVAALQGAGWLLVLTALERILPGRGLGARTTTTLLVLTGAVSGVLVFNPPIPLAGLSQSLLGTSFALLASVYAGLNLRLKGLGERGWLPGFALFAAQLLLLVILLRAFLTNGAGGDIREYLYPLLTGGVLLSALFAYPAFQEFTTRLDPHHARAIRPVEAHT